MMQIMEIDDLPFEICALVGKAHLPMGAYLALQVGDILLLEQQVGEPFVIKGGETPLFTGTPGLSETRKAVRLDERIHP